VGDDDVSVQAEPGLRLQPIRNGLLLWPIVATAERVAGACLLLFSFPLVLLAAAVAATLSRQSPLIAHHRLGQGGRDLWLLKIRTMWDGQRKQRAKLPTWTLVEKLPTVSAASCFTKVSDDPRVTSRFAACCRRYSVDELPQLWQIACGELALVGPRPLTRIEIEEHYGPDADLLLSRKPGLTGLWQVSGRSRLSYRQRRRLDIFMVRKWSLSLYLLILARTIWRAPAGKDAW
jgi:exopolysaccharide production protein ExoY